METPVWHKTGFQWIHSVHSVPEIKSAAFP